MQGLNARGFFSIEVPAYIKAKVEHCLEMRVRKTAISNRLQGSGNVLSCQNNWPVIHGQEFYVRIDSLRIWSVLAQEQVCQDPIDPMLYDVGFEKAGVCIENVGEVVPVVPN